MDHSVTITYSSNDQEHTLDVDGHRPIDPAELELEGTYEEDGKRPVGKSDFEIVDTLEVDGSRPITANKLENTQITTDYID